MTKGKYIKPSNVVMDLEIEMFMAASNETFTINDVNGTITNKENIFSKKRSTWLHYTSGEDFVDEGE